MSRSSDRKHGPGVPPPGLSLIWIETEQGLAAADALIPTVPGDAQALRRQLAEAYRQHRLSPETTQAPWRCPICWEPLLLAGRPSGQGLYVRHRKNPVYPCPNKNGSALSLSQWDALRFNGQKESARHIQLKERMGAILSEWSEVDSVEIEPTVRGTDKLSWRRPDLLATFRGLTVAIEIQLSSTYVDVIVAREAFYREQGTTVLWLFDRFTEHGHRLYEKDIYYHHNGNAFELSEAALAKTSETGVPHLTCHHLVPALADGTVRPIWAREEVPLSEITFCTDTHRVFWYDYQRELEALQSRRVSAVIRDQLRSLICLDAPISTRREELQMLFEQLRLDAGVNTAVPELDDGTVRTLELIVSAQKGAFVGELAASSSANWPFWANVVFEHYPGYAKAFMRIAERYGKTQEFSRRPAWQKKRDRLVHLRKGGQMRERTQWWPIFALIAPECDWSNS